MELTSEHLKRIEENRKNAQNLRKSRMQTNVDTINKVVQKSEILNIEYKLNNRYNSYIMQECSTDVKPIDDNINLAIELENNSINNTINQNVVNFYKQSSSNFDKINNINNKNLIKPVSNDINIQKENYLIKSLKTKIIFSLLNNTRFNVSFPYKSNIIEIIKKIPSKLYDGTSKTWNFDLKDYFLLKKTLIEELKDEIELDDFPKLVISVLEDQFNGRVLYGIPSANLSKVDDKLVRTLRPFQREAINFGIFNNGRLIIADDMGLGKTLQAICLAAYYKYEWPLLIITPSTLRFNWQQQILHWLPSLELSDVSVVLKKTDVAISSSSMVCICSYTLLAQCESAISSRNYKVVIVDESHSLKNYKSKRTNAAFPILKKAKRVILLSGTPALSRPIELFKQLSAICPKTFSDLHEYGTRYCNAKKNAWGWDYNGSSNLNELKIIMESKYLIRRMKKDVLQELPAKCRTNVILDPSSIKFNKEMKNSRIIVERTKCKQKADLLEYFHKTGEVKIPAVKEYVSYLLENDRKFIIFAHHQIMLNAIEDAVKSIKASYIRIDGNTNSEQKHFFCKKFQSDELVKVAILSITSANSGIDLSAAALVVFAELFWNPGILVQAEDRVHRMGQTDSVSVQYLIAKDTADDFLWQMIQEKMDLLSAAGLCDDNFTESDTKQLLDSTDQSLITQYFMDDEVLEKIFLDNSSIEEGYSYESKRIKLDNKP